MTQLSLCGDPQHWFFFAFSRTFIPSFSFLFSSFFRTNGTHPRPCWPQPLRQCARSERTGFSPVEKTYPGCHRISSISLPRWVSTWSSFSENNPLNIIGQPTQPLFCWVFYSLSTPRTRVSAFIRVHLWNHWERYKLKDSICGNDELFMNYLSFQE